MPKTFFTYEQQLNKLQNEKQLTITNPAYAEEILEKLSYYSLIGGYKNLFKHPASGNYLYGVTFEEIVAFYYFDEELRTLFLKDCACLFSKHNTDSVSNIAKTQH